MWIAALLLACSGEKDPDGSPTDDPPPACDEDLSFVSGPAVRGDDPLFPLSRALTATLSAPAELAITATDSGGRSVSWLSPSATDHDLAMVGLQAATTWTVVATASAAGCSAEADPVQVVIDPLVGPLPNIEVRQSRPEAMQPGLTVVPLYSKDISYIALLNAEGEIVWLHGPVFEKFTEIGVLDNGHLLALNDFEIIELDWMGEVRLWTSELSARTDGVPIAVPEFHHDVLWSSQDNLVVLSKGSRLVPDFPSDYGDPSVRTAEQVAQDRLLEVDPATGEILVEWDVTTMLDLGRIGWESLNRGESGLEWAHTNAVAEDVTNGRWILSARNQDAIFAVDQATGAVDWILANHDNWGPAFTDLLLASGPEPFDWPYHQHGVKYDPATGRVMAFDNGNYRSTPWTGVDPLPDAEAWSRLVEYTVDETARTVVQNWEVRLEPEVFSFAMGDADWLPNGNVLGDFAYVEWEDGLQMEEQTPPRGNNTVRVVEAVPATGEIVWDVDIFDSLTEEVAAWQAYRVQRIPWPNAAP